MLEFLQRLPSLQTLRIWSGSCLTDHVVDKIRNHCPDLKNVIIRGCPFHEALHKHPSLRYLHLNGQGSDEPEHNKSLIQGISQLPNLRGLKLEGVSSGFIMEDFMALTPHLPHLERLWIDGKYFCNRIWNALLCLPKLKGLTIAGRSAFKGKDILDFIDQLGPGNRGFRLSILKSTDDTDINDITENFVRDHLRSKLNGYFDFDWAEEEEYETEEEADFDDMSE
ncbi:hypothetical protein APSETT444_009473 [Aspergillus pseudonomiae]